MSEAENRTPPIPEPRTASGIEIPERITPDMLRHPDPGAPGEPPYTRGIFANGYRGRL